MKRKTCFVLLTMLIFFQTKIGLSAWSMDPTINTPVCVVERSQSWPVAVSDGVGGAIIAWWELRNLVSTGTRDIYAQKIDSKGNPLWNINGIKITTEDSGIPLIYPDNSGGAIIFIWATTGAMYAQRVDSNGNLLWDPSGVLIYTPKNAADGFQGLSASSNIAMDYITSDGSGGAIILWVVNPKTIDADLYAQRVDATGKVLWSPEGVPVCTAVGRQDFPQIISDEAGGAIVVWEDQRSGDGSMYSDIYAQRIDASGSSKWATNGIPINTSAGYQSFPRIIKVEPGLYMVTWSDVRGGIFAQKIDLNGNLLWITDGISIASEGGGLYRLVDNDVGGAIIGWGNPSIYVQMVDKNGGTVWGPLSVPFPPANHGANLLMIKDGLGGAIVVYKNNTYSDVGNDGMPIPSDDIYAQRIDSQGNLLWGNNGVAISTAQWRQDPYSVIEDMKGGAIIVFEDERNYINGNPDVDIYAQRGSADGLLGEMSQAILPWYNSAGGENSLSSFISLHNPSPFTVTVTVNYGGNGGQEASPGANTFILRPGSSLSGDPYKVSGPGEGIEQGPPYSLPNSTSPFGSATFTTLVPFGYKLYGEALRMGAIDLDGDGTLEPFSGIAPAYSK